MKKVFVWCRFVFASIAIALCLIHSWHLLNTLDALIVTCMAITTVLELLDRVAVEQLNIPEAEL